ncbi:hypothetical protein [Bacterioplanoides sp. SCSIO 12839]|uniref:hypothetical protein n=1 Tax=Bacterioplanoides sp. SCSIO 12839 TaxID=2829569 RepID=UPI00210231CB|nr:hypothetical protein [Bacterioplanoides sp. SCSIO 12839]UTW48710.1 hypothetical protein KFF03_02050 [Bacterioplanoides sp. SCSIO 12839]
MSDSQLSDATGQAFLQIDRTSQGNTDFTKFTFGMDVDVSLNADLVELGRYERSGEASGSSDIRINDFALGSVNSDGSLNPFNIKDPFFELAFEDNNGTEELVGLRVGFSEALGKLSGNIEYLTGNIEVRVAGTAAPIRASASGFQRFLLSIAGVGDSTELEAAARLVNSNGDEDQIRAQQVGVVNGDTLDCLPGGNCGAITGALLGLFRSNNCAVLGIATCFDLSNFRTLDIGQNNNPASGLFLSFQTKQVTWYDNGSGTTTPFGAFMNIPNGGITVDFEQSLNGIERVRTKLLDPYYD